MKELTGRQREILKFVAQYISAHNYPPTIREIGDGFGMSVKGAHDHIMALKRKGALKSDGRSRTLALVHREKPVRDTADIPVLGHVAAGLPILAEENRDGTITLHRSLLKNGSEYFALRVRGDSMEKAGIMDGDIAVIEQQNTAQSGEIVVAMVDDAVTLKRFFREKNRCRLQPENDRYKPIYTQDLRILGRLSKIIRNY
jgi:repressor LexA